MLAALLLQVGALAISELVFAGVPTTRVLARAVRVVQPVIEMSVLLGFAAWGAALHAGRPSPAPLIVALALGVGTVIGGRSGAGWMRIPALMLSIGLQVVAWVGGASLDSVAGPAPLVSVAMGLVLAAGCAVLLAFARDPVARREALLGWNSALILSATFAAAPVLVGRGLGAQELLVVSFLLGGHLLFEIMVSVAEGWGGKRRPRARELTWVARGWHALGLVVWIGMWADVPRTVFLTDPAVGVGGVVLAILSTWLASLPYARAVPVQRSGDFERLALRLEMGAVVAAALAFAASSWLSYAASGRSWRWSFPEVTTMALLAGTAAALYTKSGRIEGARFRQGSWLSLVMFLVCCAGMILGAPHGG